MMNKSLLTFALISTGLLSSLASSASVTVYEKDKFTLSIGGDV